MKLPVWVGRPSAHAAALLLALLAALVIVAVMIGALEYTKTRGRLLLTALLLGGFFLTTLAATGMPRAGAARRLSPAALVAATAALLLLLIGLWGTPGADGFWKAAATVTVLALGLVCAGLALGRGLTDRVVRALAWSSAALAAVLTAMAGLGIVLEIRAAPYWWAFVLLTLCWLAASAAIPAAWHWRRRGRVR